MVTSARIGASAPAEIAMQVAAELFPIRHICAFGRDLPDGVVPLDDVFGPGSSGFFQPAPRPGHGAAHVAVITFDVTDATMLSAIPPGSFAGIALTVLPWLFAGGTLALHHGFEIRPCSPNNAARMTLAPLFCRIPR